MKVKPNMEKIVVEKYRKEVSAAVEKALAEAYKEVKELLCFDLLSKVMKNQGDEAIEELRRSSLEAGARRGLMLIARDVIEENLDSSQDEKGLA